MKKTLGGDRLGSGNKMQVDLHGYERSTHNLSKTIKTTASAGTLIPFMQHLALPGDTFDIELDVQINTHPTIGPLFDGFKIQLDIFEAPIRLYQGQLHNNKLGIGMNMSQVKLPNITLKAITPPIAETPDINLDTIQINPSSILAYLGIRGVGISFIDDITRNFQALKFLSYWDIFKNYYANKQEEIGYVIHTPIIPVVETVEGIAVNGSALSEAPTTSTVLVPENAIIEIGYTGARPNPETILITDKYGRKKAATEWGSIFSEDATSIYLTYDFAKWGYNVFKWWQYAQDWEIPFQPIQLTSFNLSDIDTMKERILAAAGNLGVAFNVNEQNLNPYSLILDDNQPSLLNSQEGLAIKTYQSDKLNNWLDTEWIDGAGGINDITKIDTSEGFFNIDTLVLSRKVYDMLNRIAVSGGSYQDWLDAVYTHETYWKAETPMYHGGLIKELVFQEVVSNSESQGNAGTVPLGTLAGKGIMGKKHKGGKVVVKVNEPSYIIGIFSLTPRQGYSQGNRWDVHLETMDDLHKPALDEIGFQELITEEMAWWDTEYKGTSGWVQKSAGKQPAWIDYMTDINEVYGNFAIPGNEDFMVLTRRYEPLVNEVESGVQIKDLTTYVDPAKYNYIFAETSLDAQNFWVQIGTQVTARRKMSAKVMPNL